jgi:hypothetical protein
VTERRHGTRRQYQTGCTCTPCRAAEAAYRQALRRLRAEGKIPMGVHVDAKQMWKQIKAMRVERMTYAEIARRLGLHTPRLYLHPDRVTLKSLLRVRALYQRLMLEQPDGAA